MPPGDKTIWAGYTQGVKRLKSGKTAARTRQAAITAAPQASTDRQTERKKTVAAASPPSRPGNNKKAPAQLDKRRERQLRQGAVAPEARLDLHGLTQENAHAAFTRFIETQTNRERRLLLVITGKGHTGESVLRTNLPRWCETPSVREHVLALRPAAPRHGGAGAWYVVLRRPRKAP